MLRYVPKRFNPKVLAIEEMKKLKTLNLDQLLGTLSTYEMRIYNGKPTEKESTFKENKKPKEENDDSCYDEYE